MRINSDNIGKIVEELKPFLINQRISEIALVNSRLFLFSFKRNNKKLIVDLDNTNPHIGIIETDYDELSLPSEFVAKAMQRGSPCITAIEQINNDKVIRVTTESIDAFYHHNKYYLYIELINAHANMILTDQNNKIIVGFYETNLLSPRPIVKNGKYILPDKKNEEIVKQEFDIKNYQEFVNKSFKNSLEKRKKELFGPTIKKYEKKLKGLLRKIEKIKELIKDENEHLKYKEIGEEILANINVINKGTKKFNGIKLDPSKSISENANAYFNKYKKAKRGILINQELEKQVEKEINDTKYLCDVFEIGDEASVKLLVTPPIKNKKENIPSYMPYYIKHHDVIYYYGHNALENDYLTFKMFKKGSDVIWMHVKDTPGAHLIINKKNPTNEELDLAASLLLIKNKLNAGEIMYAERKNITRGGELAKANVLNYKSINMRKINQKAYELLKKEKRVHE